LEDNRLANEQEFIKELTRQELDKNYYSSGVPFTYVDGAVYVDNSDSHTLIFGNTGSKKTRNFCIPSVYTIGMAGESMIISDPKGEIYRNTSGFLESQGYSIHVLNLRNPQKSSRWNPLIQPYQLYKRGDADKAVEMIYDFCMQLKSQVHSDRDPYWENQAMDLLIGIILILFECEPDREKIHMESVQRIRMYIELENSNDIKTCVFWDLLRSFPDNSLIRYKLASIYSLRNVEKTLNCVVSTFDSMLRTFIFNKKLMNLMSVNEIDYTTLKEKAVLFLITPDEKTTFHFLVSVFVKQCYESLIDAAQDRENGKLPNRVNFILDEFSNFPKINDMPAMISAARSRDIRFVLCIQSKQQLLAAYGDDAETIKSNCKNWVYLSCRELSLLKEIEELCGDFEENNHQWPLISIVQLQRLKIGWEDSQALILRSGIAPHIAWVKDFSTYPQSRFKSFPFQTTKWEDALCFDVLKYVHGSLAKKLEKEDEINLNTLFEG
jgi:type IV secretion system protein VirD4